MPVAEMSDDEFSAWEQWLFTAGLNPQPIRQSAPASPSSYAWDPLLGATVERVNGRSYPVGVKDGRLVRLPSRPPVVLAQRNVEPAPPVTHRSGKSTFFDLYLSHQFPQFINADEIAKTLSSIPENLRSVVRMNRPMNPGGG